MRREFGPHMICTAPPKATSGDDRDPEDDFEGCGSERGPVRGGAVGIVNSYRSTESRVS